MEPDTDKLRILGPAGEARGVSRVEVCKQAQYLPPAGFWYV